VLLDRSTLGDMDNAAIAAAAAAVAASGSVPARSPRGWGVNAVSDSEATLDAPSGASGDGTGAPARPPSLQLPSLSRSPSLSSPLPSLPVIRHAGSIVVWDAGAGPGATPRRVSAVAWGQPDGKKIS
jgi:hypothetical protein